MEGSLSYAKKRFSAEQIVTPLCQIEVLMARGKSTPEIVLPIRISVIYV